MSVAGYLSLNPPAETGTWFIGGGKGGGRRGWSLHLIVLDTVNHLRAHFIHALSSMETVTYSTIKYTFCCMELSIKAIQVERKG